MNDRLELAVGDAVKDVSTVNHFRHFLESIYNLFSQSNKNQRELTEACRELEVQFLQNGRVLDMWCVSSRLRTVRAVWTCYGVLHAMLSAAADDLHRDSKTRIKMKGLAKHLASVQFVSDIGLMYDVLQKLSSLSPKLQKCTKCKICVLETFIENPSKHLTELHKAARNIGGI